MIMKKTGLSTLDKLISLTIEREGINPCHKGYKYLKNAIMIVIFDNYRIDAMTKEIYTQIAQDHITTPEAVERNIRFAIYRAFCSKQETPKPTNKEFIFNISNRTLDEMNAIINQNC